MSLKKRIELLSLMNNCFEGGFTISETVQFLWKLRRFPPFVIATFEEALKNGNPMNQPFETIGFPLKIVTQVELSERNGNLVETLRTIERQMRLEEKERKALFRVGSYPLLLFLLMTSVLFFLKYTLLPELMVNLQTEKNVAVSIVEILPDLFFVTLLLLVAGVLLAAVIFKKRSPLKSLKLLTTIPILNQTIKLYITAEISREWGTQFVQGYELCEIVQTMGELNTFGFMKELGMDMKKQVNKGMGLFEQVERWTFVSPAFSMMILTGEMKDKLGEELLMYSEMCMTELVERVEKWMGRIQPITFVILSILIIGIYAAILLPIYESMGEVL
jgi:competence protein ComGB